MGDAGRPFDIKPTVFIAIFSVLLASALVVVNSRLSSQHVETAAMRVLEESAERVAARQVGAQPASRQIVSPALSPDAFALVDDDVSVAVARTGEGTDGDATDMPADATTGGGANASDQAGNSAGLPSATAAPGSASSIAPSPATTTTPAPATTISSAAESPSTTQARATTATTTATGSNPPTTATREAATATTTTIQPVIDGRYSVAQVIDGTIGAGDGSNPNEEAPMGRHDASLYLPQGWNWAQGPTRNSAWGDLGTGQFQRAELRCAVIPENGHNPQVPFRVNVREGAYYQYANGSWNKAFDMSLTSTNNGAYLGRAGQLNTDPFSNGGPGRIEWRREADGSYSAPWNSSALMMHFWAGARQLPASGQTAEFATAEMRLQQPDGQTVDLSQVKVLFQCGIDYYSSTGGQGTKVPGPGIAKYHRLTTSWNPSLWVTLPKNEAANSVQDFRRWLEAHLPPDVRP